MDLFNKLQYEKKLGKNEPEYLNNITHSSIYSRALMLATRRFKWEGSLLDNIPDWFMETSLFYNACIAYVKDKEMGDLILPAFPADSSNIYYIPKEYRLQGFGWSKTYPTEDLIILRNNFIGESTFEVVNPVIEAIYESVRCKDVNIQNSKLAILFKTNKKKELTVRNLVNKIFKNFPAIYGEETQTIANLEVINQNVPFLVDKLDTHTNAMWGELLTLLGIQTHAIEKSERVQVAEVQAANEQTKIYKEAAIQCRKKWCEEVSAKSGKDISVEWIIEDLPILGGNASYEGIFQGGDMNGSLYNGTSTSVRNN